jgi:hypothetical protein
VGRIVSIVSKNRQPGFCSHSPVFRFWALAMRRLLKRPLRLRDILTWAAAHREATGRWPTQATGAIPGAIGATWARVDTALRNGLRGLPGGSSLAQLLAENCGARHLHRLPRLTERHLCDFEASWLRRWW